MRFGVFFLMCFVVICSSCASMFVNSSKMEMDAIDDYTLQKVIEINESTQKIFEGIKAWIAKSIKTEKENDVIYNQDEGTINGFGSITLFSKTFRTTAEIFLDFSIEIREGRYRITFKNMYTKSIDKEKASVVKNNIAGKDNIAIISNAFYDYELIKKINQCIIGNNPDSW